MRIHNRVGALLLWLIVPAVFLPPIGSDARWMKLWEPVPVQRLITNVTQYVKQHPADPQGYYVLASSAVAGCR